MPTLVALITAYLLSQFYRSFLAVLAPELARDLALDAAALGRISAAWFVVFALAQFLVGWSLDRFGPRRTVSIMMLASVAGAGLLAVAQQGWHCLVALGLIGLGNAPIYMGTLLIVGRRYSVAQFATLSAAILGIGQLGNLVAATPLAAAIEAFGWRGTVAASAVLTLLSALAVAIVVRDPARVERPGGSGSTAAEFFELLSLRPLWLLFPIAMTAYATAAALRGLWIGPYFDDVFALGTIERGNAATVMVVAMIGGAFLYGPLDRIFGTRKGVVIGGSALMVAALLALAWLGDRSVVGAVALFAVIGAAGMVNSVIMAHGRAFLPDHLLGRGISLINFCIMGGVGLIQPVSGVVVRDGLAAGRPPAVVYAGLFELLAATLAVSLVVYLASRDAPVARRTG